MKKVLGLTIKKPDRMSVEDWASQNFKKIEEAAAVDAAIDSADAITISNAFTERETFDTTTVTLPQLAEVVATLLTYIATQGPRKE